MFGFCGKGCGKSFPQNRTLDLDLEFGKCEPLSMNLSEARKARGWSQEELAGRLGLKSKGYICDVESGSVKPSLRVAIGIYRELGVKTAPIADLTDREIAILEKTSRARAA